MDIAYCIGYLKAYRYWYEVAKDQLVGEQQRYCEPENINFKDIQRCQPWRAKRRLVDPSSREAALLTRRAHSARGKAK